MCLKILFLMFICILYGKFGESKEIVCYYRSWKVYNTCKIEDLDPNQCSILIYAFAGVDRIGTIEQLDYNADIALGGYKKFNALKKQNPQLKTLLSINGGKNGSRTFSEMAESEFARKQFVSSAVDYMRTFGFNGVDIDWEYPGLLGGRAQDKENFVKLLQEVRNEFDKYGYLLTVAVAFSDSIIAKSYNVPEISRYVDYINLMTYNMNDYKTGRTGENAPLLSNNTLNVLHSTRAWISKGANASKIILGVAAYGKTFTLTNPANSNGIGSPAKGPGLPGVRSKTAGYLSYDEIVENEKSGWSKKWSSEQKVPYLYQGNQWVGYDDSHSIKKKVMFANENKLGGVMVWSVDMDDARGLNGVPFPLLRTINKYLPCN